MSLSRIILIAVATGLNPVLRAQQLPLVENGRAVSAIVVEKAPEKPPAEVNPSAGPASSFERHEALVLKPARDIQEALRKMSGAEVPLIAEGDPLPKDVTTRVFVGRTEAARKAGVKFFSGCDLKPRPDAFEEEGYVLQSKGSDLYIVGNQDGIYAGTAYGCYAFLERLGCRWFFPGTWGEVIPKRATVKVGELNVESRPDFPVRSIGWSGWVKISRDENLELSDWMVKIGLRPAGRMFGGTSRYIYPGASDSTLNSLLPPKEYGRSRPDFYATRQDGTQPTNGSSMLCLSNPDVLSESIKNLSEAFDGRRKIGMAGPTGAGFSPPDGTPYCYCKACQAEGGNFNYPRYIHNPMSSELYFKFMAGLANAFPDKYITCHAYAGREAPPQGMAALPPNVAIIYAPIACDVLHPDNHPKSWRRQEMWSILSKYRRMTPHVIVRDYNPGLVLGFFVPERMAENLAVNIPEYKKLGIKGMAPEGRKSFMQTWLSYYVMSKLLWDAETDVEALKRDFYTTFFGEAAGTAVRAWWDAIADTLVNADILAHEDWLLTHIYTADFATRLHAHVQAAQAAATEEPYRSRVAAFALIADHFEAFAAMFEAEKNMDLAAALREAERMEADKVELNALYPHFIDNGLWHRVAMTSASAVRDHRQWLEMTQGTNGALVAALPLECPFRRDPFNRGVLMEWYAADFAEADWETRNTFFLWDQQEKPLTAAGDDWDGYGWYRMHVDIPAQWKGKPMRLRLGGVINEAWVWVNGNYAGHRPHRLWWSGDRSLDLDISAQVRPGQENLIAIRVHNDTDIGGIYRRGFLYSPVK